MPYPNGDPTPHELTERASALLGESERVDPAAGTADALAGIGYALLAIHAQLEAWREMQP